jgi:DNA-binding SARP family transcriptional activator
MLQVCLLGHFRMSASGAKVEPELGHAGRGMASYLFTFPGKQLRRERLATMFWPESDEKHARGALNSAVWRIKKAINSSVPESAAIDTVCSSDDYITFEPRPWIQVDKVLFEERLNQIIQSDLCLNSRARRQELQQLLELNSCPYLESEATTWALAEREKLNQLKTKVTRMLVKHMVRALEFDQAVTLSSKLVLEDSFREAVIREHIAILAMNGQRIEAIRFYSNWTEELRQELDVGPMSQTIDLVEKVRTYRCDAELMEIRSLVFD